jgi:membrane protein YdbS with pleckstrin-like domain
MSRSADTAAAWIYRGVWASVVALFRVPAEPPTLPVTGEPIRSLRPAHGFLRYLKFFFWLLLIPGDILPLVAWGAIAMASPVLAVVLAVPFLAVLIVPDVIAYVAIHLRYDTTWYVLTDRSMRIRRGIWSIHETTISFENVQNVEVRQGPVQRYFAIFEVVVQTAGGGARAKGEGASTSGAHVGILQGLDDGEAVRDLILDRVRRTRTAGLGDERPAAALSAPSAAVPAFSAAHLAVLREIRDAAHRLERA